MFSEPMIRRVATARELFDGIALQGAVVMNPGAMSDDEQGLKINMTITRH